MGDAGKINNEENRLVTKAGRAFLQKTLDLMVEETLVKGVDTENKVLDYMAPEQLQTYLNLSIHDEGSSCDEMLEVFQRTIASSVRTAHPRYYNQLYNGRSLESLASSWIVESLNTNVHTYECAPAFTVAEQYVIQKVNEKIGYPEGDGIFMPGGTMCNFTALHLARYTQDNTVKQRGLAEGSRKVIFSTADAHFSVSKGAHFLGFGTDNVIDVDTDDGDRMIPEELEMKILETIEKGDVPLCVMATAGTTVLGAFDPLDRLADICHKHDVWLHVDACWGGGVLFSDQHKHIMRGVERTDSVAISFHKMLGVQLQCAALMVREKGVLSECNKTEAAYLFQPDKHYDPFYDIGLMSVQCGRKADGYKLWALWKAQGNKGFEKRVNSSFELAAYFTEQLRKREGYRLVAPKFEYVNICFWYIPPSLRGKPQTPEWWKQIDKMAPQIKKRMVDAGSTSMGYNPLESKGYVNFFRIIMANPLLTREDLDFTLDEIDRLGKDL